MDRVSAMFVQVISLVKTNTLTFISERCNVATRQ